MPVAQASRCGLNTGPVPSRLLDLFLHATHHGFRWSVLVILQI